MASDIQRLVVGLVDTQSVADPAPVPYLGLEITPGPSYATATPSYHAAIAGLYSGGSFRQGLLDLGSTSLSGSEKVDFRRYLYTTTSTLTGDSKTVDFTGIRPGSNRYVVFAAAFNQADNASDSHAIGWASASVSLPFAPASATTAPSLNLTLDRLVGTLNIDLTINPSLSTSLNAIQELVIGAVDNQTDQTLRPLTLGYRYDWTPAGSTTSVSSTDQPTTPSNYFSQVRDNMGSPLTSVQRDQWERYLWFRRSHDTLSPAGTTSSFQLANLPSSVQTGDYTVFALAFQKGVGSTTFSTFLGAATQSATVTTGGTTNINLTLTLVP